MHEGNIMYIMRVLNREIQRLRDNIMTYRLQTTAFRICELTKIDRKMYHNPLSLFSIINEMCQF